MTELIEFKNHKGETLRALFDRAKSACGIICVHGFERTSIESKFKNIFDEVKGKVNLFRFDFSGCGISDGSFIDTTCQKLTTELKRAISIFKNKCPIVKRFILIAHSFGCCVALHYTFKNNNIHKLILFAPAFNQKELQQYWFTQLQRKDKRVTWRNYKQYFSKASFMKEMNKPKRISKEHYISKKYFLENKDMDYQRLLKGLGPKTTIIVHGDADEKVPMKSNDQIPNGIKIIKVRGGDHDLQRQDMVKQYLNKVIRTIKNYL